MKFGDLQWFEPLWRRIAVLAVCAGWTALEFWRGDQTWGFLVLAVTAYCVWTFFITFDKNLEKAKNEQPPPTP